MTEKCKISFNHLRDLLMEYPILRYPDPSKPYTMYIDVSGIGWSGVLMQEETDDKGKSKSHPICYVSGQFRDSQLNWAALTKKAYAIYMSIRRLMFYLTDAEITIKCDHLPLRKFLNKQTLNSKVNNWAVELEQFNLKMEWIQGSKNTLADSLSHLLEVVSEAKLEAEPEGQEFGCYCFDDLTPVRMVYVEEIGQTMLYENENTVEIKIPLKKEDLRIMQKKDSYCRDIANKLRKKQHLNKMVVMANGILYGLWMEHDKTFKCILVPISLRDALLNRYILTVIDMLTGYMIAVPIPDKKSETVCGAYRDNVYCTFGGSSRILTDNGTEFKSQEMKAICEELNIKHVFSPVYTPQANGRLEGWHHFLKACIAKHIHGKNLEWDKLVPLAVSAYNFFPCQSSRESHFVLMFGRDPITPVAKLLEPRPRYYGDKGGTLRMDMLRKLYLVTAENIRRAREKGPRKKTSSKVQVGDLVFI